MNIIIILKILNLLIYGRKREKKTIIRYKNKLKMQKKKKNKKQKTKNKKLISFKNIDFTLLIKVIEPTYIRCRGM